MKVSISSVGQACISVVLGYSTCSAITAIDNLPPTSARGTITDYLSFPGGIIAWLFYPEGVHTGSGAPRWGLVVHLGNVLFYSCLWFVALLSIRKWRFARRMQDRKP
jgi:hypothetical protein